MKGSDCERMKLILYCTIFLIVMSTVFSRPAANRGIQPDSISIFTDVQRCLFQQGRGNKEENRSTGSLLVDKFLTLVNRVNKCLGDGSTIPLPPAVIRRDRKPTASDV